MCVCERKVVKYTITLLLTQISVYELVQLLLFLFCLRDVGRCWRSNAEIVLREIKPERWAYSSWRRMWLGITGFIHCQELQQFQSYRNLQFRNSESFYRGEVPVCYLIYHQLLQALRMSLVYKYLIKQMTLTRHQRHNIHLAN